MYLSVCSFSDLQGCLSMIIPADSDLTTEERLRVMNTGAGPCRITAHRDHFRLYDKRGGLPRDEQNRRPAYI
jgi:hypothetical protein